MNAFAQACMSTDVRNVCRTISDQSPTLISLTDDFNFKSLGG